MAVVIFGDTDNFKEHRLVQQAVEERGERTHVVEVQRWPGNGPVAFPVDGDDCVFDESIPFEEVTGVFSMIQSVFPEFVRTYDWFDEMPERDAYDQLREYQRAFRAAVEAFEIRGANVIVSPTELHWNLHRPWMLALFDDAGIPVPDTTFTNDPERVVSFVEEHAGAIVQGVNGGGRPELIRPSDLQPERLEKLAAAPVKLQEYVPGVDTRAFVVDGEFAGMVRYEYDSDAISFRSSEVDYTELGSKAISPSPELEETVVRAAELGPAAYAAVDVRLTEDGEFTVLESNVPGRFAAHDVGGSTDVADRIATYLIGS